jgi:predicted lipid-binding transport protein (Tim44 family)
MSDEQGVQPMTDGASAASPAASPKAGGLKGFMGTTLGKIVVIGLAVGVLVTILAVVAVIVLGGLGLSLLGGLTDQPTGVPAVTPAPGSGVATAAVPPVAVVGESDVFTPRDPFQQIVLPASALEGSDSAVDDANTLTLLEIIDENGVRKAVVQLGATKYTLAAGESIGGSPWQVVSVGTSSAVMLYGDTQITLTVGQGISMK